MSIRHLTVWMEVQREDTVELKVDGILDGKHVILERVTHKGRDAELTSNERVYAIELLEAASCDVDFEDTFPDLDPYTGAED